MPRIAHHRSGAATAVALLSFPFTVTTAFAQAPEGVPAAAPIARRPP